jgi:hypothetical protein
MNTKQEYNFWEGARLSDVIEENDDKQIINYIDTVINKFKCYLNNNTFVNIEQITLLDICVDVIRIKDYNNVIINKYNDFIDYLKEVENKTTISSSKLHDNILSKVEINDYNVYKDDDGKYNIILRPQLERQSHYDLTVLDNDICKLLLQIRNNLRDEFLYREYYLDYIQKEYIYVQSQIIINELIIFENIDELDKDHDISILLRILKKRYKELTNDIEDMLVIIKNTRYSHAIHYAETYMDNVNNIIISKLG